MGTPNIISGRKKGQVTEKIAVALTNLYAVSLKNNAPDIQARQNAVPTSLKHI